MIVLIKVSSALKQIDLLEPRLEVQCVSLSLIEVNHTFFKYNI